VANPTLTASAVSFQVGNGRIAAAVANSAAQASSVKIRRSASRQAAESSNPTGTHPPPSAFSRNTGKSLHTQGTPSQSDSSSGRPQPSARVGKTEALACA
jgi:hypothetical protein